MKYTCENPNCGQRNLVAEVSRISIRVVGGKVVREGEQCPECGEPRTDITERGDKINVTVARVGSMSIDQKAEYLDKRAKKHYDKHVKPFRDHQHNTAKNQMAEINQMHKERR